jgi:hypothetical protein
MTGWEQLSNRTGALMMVFCVGIPENISTRIHFSMVFVGQLD